MKRIILALVAFVVGVTVLTACDPQYEPLPNAAGWTVINLSGDCSQATGLAPGNYIISMAEGTSDCPRLNVSGSPTDVIAHDIKIVLDEPIPDPLGSAGTSGINAKNRAGLIQNWTGEFWMDNIEVHGPYIYEGFNVRGDNAELMVIQDLAVMGPILSYRHQSGTGAHRGGDLLQTDGGELAEMRIHGLFAPLTYQGLFLQYGPTELHLDGVQLHNVTRSEMEDWHELYAPSTGLTWTDFDGTTAIGEHYWPGSHKLGGNSSVRDVYIDECDVVIDHDESHVGVKTYAQIGASLPNATFHGAIVQEFCDP